MQDSLQSLIAKSDNRVSFWSNFIAHRPIHSMAEIGVYKGDFAAHMLQTCPSITQYYLLDPWRHLDEWNKPANQPDDIFESFLSETRTKTDFAGEKRIFLRGTTTEVIDQIPDNSLDFAYIDGDHTLKGITIDLINIWPKIKTGGFVGGDDFSPSIWQHSTKYEPTLVFPYTSYFAEAMNCPVYGLPYEQFLLQKTFTGYAFTDLAKGVYKRKGIKDQIDYSRWRYLMGKALKKRMK